MLQLVHGIWIIQLHCEYMFFTAVAMITPSRKYRQLAMFTPITLTLTQPLPNHNPKPDPNPNSNPNCFLV